MAFNPWFGPHNAADYFRSLLPHDVSETQVLKTNRYLLECVHSGGITPKIFAVWLFLAHPRFPGILRDALRDEASYGVRHAGINVLKCALKTDLWRENGWDALGGTVGMSEIFEKLSMQEVRSLARAIGSLSNSGHASKLRAVVDELLELLLPSFLECSSTEDGRRQLLSAADLVPLFNMSSDAMLIKVFSKDRPEDFIDPLLQQLLISRVPLLRAFAIGSAPVSPPIRRRLLNRHMYTMLTSRESYQSKIHRGRQASIPVIDITLDLLNSAPDGSEVLVNQRVHYIEITLTIARRSKVPFDEILAFLEQVLLPTFRGSQRGLNEFGSLIRVLIQLWTMAAFSEAYTESISEVPAARRRDALHPSRPSSEAHKQSLEKMVRNAFSTLPKIKLGSYVNTYLPHTVAKARLSLLKIICKSLRDLGIDLDQPIPSKDEEQLLPLSSSILMSLPGRDARWLFDRASRLSSTKRLTTPIPFEWPASGGDSSSFLESMIQVLLESASKEEANVARELIEDVKLKATKARDSGDRLQWAKLTVSIAILSKNVQTLHDVISWTSRFLRDPFVRPSLITKIYKADVASVLSCVTSPTLENLAADIAIADTVIRDLMKQALLVLQEPWYKAGQDCEFSSLLRRVVSGRINAVKNLCRRGVGSEEEVVATLLDGTVPIIKEYESVGITEGYESLKWGRISGLLEDIGCPKSPKPGVLKFMNLLAELRDRLWAQQRLLRNPQTASFPEGLPRGLPLQYLFPSKEWTIEVMKSQEVGNFVTKRVVDIVFCDATTALQKINPEDYRLGPFVDSLKFAMSVYIGNGPRNEQGKRILEIWRHYSENMPSSAGHKESIQNYLCHLLQSSNLHELARMIEPPQLPSLEIFQSMSRDSPSFEWEPRSENTRPPSRAHLEDTLLQYRFSAFKQKGSLEALILVMSYANPWDSSASSKTIDIWRPAYGPLRVSCQHKEALIASALLFLDSLTRNSGRLLSRAFPETSGDLRYPAVHLSYEFLSSVDDQGEAARAAIALLAGLVKIVPPSLLYELSLSLLETLHELESGSPKYALVQRCTFETMALLQRSDKPELAAILGLKSLQLFPSASSWHRQAFPPSLAKRLDRKTAERIMHEFTGYIFKAIKKQKEATGSVKKANPGIKITTIKMLGTMLAENKFGVSPSFTIDSLKNLFQEFTHIDVRVTVCAALLDILKEVDDAADQCYETFTSLASYAAGPSETNNGFQSGKAGELAMVDSQRPLLDLFTCTAYNKLPRKYHEQYVHKILLPLVDESTRQHNLWMRQFLAQLELTPEELSVTDFGPFKPDLIHMVMDTWFSYLPREFLDTHRTWVLRYLDCVKLRNINDKLTEQNRYWRTTNAGNHWQQFFDSHAQNKSFRVLLKGLDNDEASSPKVANGITFESVAEEVVACAAIIVRNPFKFVSGRMQISQQPFKNLLSELEGTTPKRRAKVLPIVERIVATAQGLRTQEWNNDPQRSPPVLPAHLQLQALLLPFPHFQKESSSSSRYAAFTSCVLDLVEESYTDVSKLIADMGFLCDAMNRVASEDLHECALGFGRGFESSASTVVQYVRVSLAQVLVNRLSRMNNNKHDAAIQEMISQWKRSSNESVRSIGWATSPAIE